MKKSLKINVSITLVTILIMLILLEVGLHILFINNHNDFKELDKKYKNTLETSNPFVISIINPYYRVFHYISNDTLNSYGFRDYEYKTQKPNKVIRIAILGDSNTFGHGIKNLSNTYPKVLEKLLNEKYKSIEIEVLNFGIFGTNILDNYWILKNKVLDFNPDIILYGVYENDFDFAKHNINQIYCYKIEDEPHKLVTPLFLEIQLYNLIRNLKTVDGYYSYNALNEGVLPWKCFGKILEITKDISKQNDFEFIGFLIPSESHPDVYNIEVSKKINTYIIEQKLRVIDNFNSLFWNETKGLNDTDLKVNVEKGELHYNELGNKIIADVLNRYIINNKIIENIIE